jgi:hypothetical protein
MKKKMLVLLLFLLAACSPSQSPAAGVTPAVGNDFPPTGTPVVEQPVAAATVTPQPLPTEKMPSPTPEVQSTLYSFVAEPTLASLAYQEYDPKEWELIPGSEHLPNYLVLIDPDHRLWQTGGQHLIYFDGKS